MPEATTPVKANTAPAQTTAPAKTLHELMLDGLQKAALGIAEVEDYRYMTASNKPAEKPNLSLALRQFPDVFYTETPEAASKKPGQKLLDWKLDSLAFTLVEIKLKDNTKEETPLKALATNSEKYIDPTNQQRFDAVVAKGFAGIEKIPTNYGPIFSLTKKGGEFETTTPQNASNFLKVIYIQALEEKYAGSGLDIKKHLPSDPTPTEIAKSELKATTLNTVKPEIHPEVEAIKNKIEQSANRPAAPAEETTQAANKPKVVAR